MDVQNLSQQLATGSLTATALARQCIERIQARNGRLHAVAELLADRALQRAAELDAELQAGHIRGPLHGIPVLVKELIDIRGVETRHGSLCYGAAPATESAPLVQRLEAAGAVILGTTHMVEFAMGSWGTNAARGTPLNPHGGAQDWYAGGSSSGSAVAVAAGFAPLAIGSDTGGSVRIPSTICGVVGFKPSFGTIPTTGVAPLAPSFDTIGALGNTIADVRLACEVMAGRPFALAAPLPERLTFLTLDDAALAPADPEVLAAYHAECARLQQAGHHLHPARLPATIPELQQLNGQIVAFEAYRRFHPQAENPASPMDPNVRERVLAGRAVSAETYEALKRQCRALAQEYARAQPEGAVLLIPGTPIPAGPLTSVDEHQIPLSRYTRVANCLDLCAIALPTGHTGTGAPLGVQLCLPGGQDGALLAVAAAFDSWR